LKVMYECQWRADTSGHPKEVCISAAPTPHPEAKRSRMQTLLAAHEVVFFYRIPNLPQPESQRPGATGVSMA